MASSADPVYRAGLHAATCEACRDGIRHGEDRVILHPTWQKTRHQLCKSCWLGMLEAYGKSLTRLALNQAELPDPAA